MENRSYNERLSKFDTSTETNAHVAERRNFEKRPVDRSHLLPREWVALSIFMLAMCFLTYETQSFFGRGSGASNDESHFLADPMITVFVEGEVKAGGLIEVKRGTLIEEVLKRAEPTPNADLKRFKPDAKVRDGQVLKVPAKKAARKAKKAEKISLVRKSPS